MNKGKELVRNTVILAIGKFCTQFITLLLLPLYTYCLTTEDYGYIDLIQTYLTFFVPLIILKLDSGIFRFLIDVRQDEGGKSKILTTGLFIVLLQNIFSIIVYIILVHFIDLKYNVLIIGNIITLSLVTFFLEAKRGLGNNKEYSISSIISATVTILCNATFLLVFHQNGKFVLISSLIANLCCLLFLLLSNNIFRYIKIRKLNKQTAKELIKYSLPLIPNEISWWVVNLSDRTILSYVIGVSANAIYSISCKISNILTSLFSIFNMSWHESASIHINDNDSSEFFSEIINKTLNLFISICAIIIVCLPILFNIIIGESYLEAYNYIPILLMANIFTVLFNLIGTIYIAKKLTKKIAKTTVLTAIINIVINLLFIKSLGLYAAAISTLISYAILAIYRYFDVKKYVEIKINIKYILYNCIVITIATVFYYINKIYLTIIGIILVIIYALIINKVLIDSGIKMIKGKVKGRNIINGK